MKCLILGIAIAILAFPQTTGTTTQQARDCAQNFVGNNNTGTVTCYNVDKKLSEQISQLVAASKRDGKTLKSIAEKIDEVLKEIQSRVPTPGSIGQSSSGGFSIQQGTTGNNSPIINSPITVGDLPKSIQPQDKETLRSFFRSAPNKARIQISADQISGAAPFPDDFYDALKDGGWPMADAGVNHMMAFYAPGRRFQGATLSIKGEPQGPDEKSQFFAASDPILYISRALEAFKIQPTLRRDPKQEEGLITITFQGGFPR